MTDSSSFPHRDTRMVRGSDDHIAHGDPVSIPIHQTTIYAVGSSERLGEAFRTGSDRFYARLGNPTVENLARSLARLEGAESAVMFGSGMAAMSTTALALVERNGHAVVHDSAYGQTISFFEFLRDAYGVTVTFVDATDPASVEASLTPETGLVVIETPCNPKLRVIDIAAIAEQLRDHDCPLVVDSTFGSPALQRPIELGADLVVHSCTKYIGGHSDVMGGVVAGSHALVGRIRKLRASLGAVLDPHAAWLIQRGLKTLSVRMRQQCDNALEIARALEDHSAVLEVRYPLLDSHPDAGIARRQMAGGGGVVSFRLRGGLAAGRRFLDGLQLIPIATSLGGVETVIEIPQELDYSMDGSGGATAASPDQPCLVRLSVGIEDVRDLRSDLLQALDQLNSAGG